MKHLTVMAAVIIPSLLATQPKASLEKDSIEFGTIYAGDVKSGKISLKNIGNKPLEILQVTPSCGCTTTKQPTTPIAAGKSDVIEITFNSSGFRGEIHKQVYISTNDPNSPSLMVNMTGVIKEDFEPTGQSGLLWMSVVQIGKPVEQTATWKNISGKPITVRNVTTDSKQLALRWEKKIVPPSETYSVSFVLTPTKENYQTDTFTLETDSPHQRFVVEKISFIGQKEAKP